MYHEDKHRAFKSKEETVRYLTYLSVCALSLFLILAGGFLAFAASEREGPHFIIPMEERVHDFGKVEPGRPLHHTFTVRNSGGADLQITRVSPT